MYIIITSPIHVHVSIDYYKRVTKENQTFFFNDEPPPPSKYHNYLNICYDSFQINV